MANANIRHGPRCPDSNVAMSSAGHVKVAGIAGAVGLNHYIFCLGGGGGLGCCNLTNEAWCFIVHVKEVDRSCLGHPNSGAS